MSVTNGGAFVPAADVTVTGLWTFTTNPVFPGSSTGPTIANPTLTGTIGGAGTYTTPTLTTPVITTGLTASGSASNDFSASTGTFKTSLGANSLGGAVTIDATTTPSLTTSAGRTNTGYVQINGKTSGALKLTAADATAQTVTVTTAAQTSGGSTLTIPDQAGVSSNFVFDTLAGTLTNKTLAVSTIFQPDKCLSTQTFTSNATLTNLTGLSWTVAASGVYYFRCLVALFTQTANGGAKMAFKLTTATLSQINLRVYLSTDTDNTGAVSTSFTTTTDQATWFDQKTVVYTYGWIEGMFTVGTGGTIAIQAAQNTSAGGGDATVLAGIGAQMIRVA